MREMSSFCEKCAFIQFSAFAGNAVDHVKRPRAVSPFATTESWRCSIGDSQVTRRAILTKLAVLCVAAVTPAGRQVLAEDASPGLPRGAREFNSFRGAQIQWQQVGEVLNAGREISSEEWNSLRGFLRTFYKVADDIEFLSSNFPDSAKERAKLIAKNIRRTTRNMDKVAGTKDRTEFKNLHAGIAAEVDEFYDMMKSAAASDVPQDL